MRLRLYHHPDGARVAYREAGTGPPLGLLHSIGLSHREWEPVVEHLAGRFRVVLPDLPLHGLSEDAPEYPYTPDWLAEVVAGFCREILGPRPLVGGHGAGAELLLRAMGLDLLRPARLVLTPSRLHRPVAHPGAARAWRTLTRAAALPGLDRALSHGAGLAFRPALGPRLSTQGGPATGDLVRHALMDVPGNPGRARAWARFARTWSVGPQPELADVLRARPDLALLLLWADADHLHPLAIAEEVLGWVPAAQLRVLSGTGFLMAYDDPVGVGRELSAFCG